MVKIKVYIEDRYCYKEGLTNESFLVYLALRHIIISNTNKYCISLGGIIYALTGKQTTLQTTTKYILNGIEELIKSKHITLISNDRKLEWVFDLSKLVIKDVKKDEKVDTEHLYSSIESKIIAKILNLARNDKISLLRFYCYLITTIQKSGTYGGVGFTYYKDMSIETGIGRQTISKYMDTLEELKIICIYRSKESIVYDNGEIREISHTYGDYKSKDQVIKLGRQHENKYSSKVSVTSKLVRKENAYSTRSAVGKFKFILKDIDDNKDIRYSTEECHDIYDVLVKYNEKYKYDDKLIKDLSVFQRFNFYDGG